MFIKKSTATQAKLADTVPKVTRTEFIFWNINDDLGTVAEQIMKAPPQVRMAYGYARRAAVAAMYLQGIVNKDTYGHVTSIFKALQHQTGQTVDFQELAGSDSIEFMQSYHYLISSVFVKALIGIAHDYAPPATRLSDAELFAEVMDTVHAEQEQRRKR
jgi:hypothetical protein